MGKTKPLKPGGGAIGSIRSGNLADLIGNSVSIKEADGSSIVVPADKSGNRVANMVLAAQIRAVIERSLKTYKDKDMLPTPKDLKDLADAAKSLHQFSGEVYREDADTPVIQPKNVQKEEGKDEDISFDEALDATANKEDKHDDSGTPENPPSDN